MKIPLTSSEQFETAKLRQGFETCSELLDEFFEPWILHLFRSIRRKLSALNRFQNPRHVTVLWLISIIILLEAVFFLALNTFHQNHYDTFVITEKTASSNLSLTDEIFSDSVRSARETELVDINSASADELCLLPGIGTVIAQRIIDERSVHGAFHYPEDLLCVSGIGEKTLVRIAPYLVFGSATAETP